MNCLFCNQEMWNDESTKQPMLFIHNSCNSLTCMVNMDFPRYICGTDKDGNVCYQEYAIGDFYVKVSDVGSRIYKLISCMLEDEIKIERPMWIDATNLDWTLDKLKLWAIFS